MKKKFTLAELASLTDSRLVGDPSHTITGVNSLDEALENEASFLANDRYHDSLKRSKAGVICTSSEVERKNLLISKDPSKTFQKIVELLSEKKRIPFKGISPRAIVDKSAKIKEGVNIAPSVVIDKGVSIEESTTIYPNCYIGENVSIGKDCLIHANVTIRENCRIGNNVIIQPGAVIGSCGFGLIKDNEGRYSKINHVGVVVIEDNVEIGANTTIDRARFKETIIREGTKIDNLVQIAHNVEIGKNCAIAAQSGFSGSSKTGDNVIIAGQVGVAGHLKLDDNVMVAAQSGISKNLKAGKYRGTPAIDFDRWNREYVYMRRVKNYIKKIEELEKKIIDLEKKVGKINLS